MKPKIKPTNKRNKKEKFRTHRMKGCESEHTGPCTGELWQCQQCNKKVCYVEGTTDNPNLCGSCWSIDFLSQGELQ